MTGGEECGTGSVHLDPSAMGSTVSDSLGIISPCSFP